MNYSCYLCANKNISVIRSKLRHAIIRKVLKCHECGLVFLEPKKENLGDFYNRNYRKLYTPILNKACPSREIFNIYLPFQQKRIARFKHLLNEHSRILEIGCSTGHFLYAVKKHVKECVGIEINAKNAAFARKKCKVKVFSSPLKDTSLPKNYFDVIFLFETLEHMNDPIELLKTAAGFIKPQGSICIQVPNRRDALLSMYKLKSYANFYYREPHIYYFSAQSLLMLACKAGYNGKVTMLQEYGFLNHLHWKIANKPMSSITEGVGNTRLIDCVKTGDKAAGEVNRWFREVDIEYKRLLCKHNIAQSIVFVGKKKKLEQHA